MAVRFRRSIKICKGLRININKNSLGLSVGPRGLGYTINTKGRRTTHIGIPGTGLSYVSTENGITNKPTTNANLNSKSTMIYRTINFKLDENGKWHFYDENGNEIFDQTLINKVKKNPSFIKQKDIIISDRNEKISKEVDEYNQNAENIINIYKMSSYPILDEQDYLNEVGEIVLQRYEPEEYSIPAPTVKNIKAVLLNEAREKIKDIKFRNMSDKWNEYINSNIKKRYNDAFDEWENNKSQFEKEEREKANTINNNYIKEYNDKIDYAEKIINGDENVIDEEIALFLDNIELPLEFNVNYSFIKSKYTLLIDLDLPEIEDIPSNTAKQLVSGTKKIVEKSIQDIKDDYKQFVYGFAVFLVSHLFNISPKILQIIISGYTQRRNKKGDLQDDYIYSIVFDRKKLKKYNTIEENAIFVCNGFKNRCIVSKYSDFSVIEPYTIEDGTITNEEISKVKKFKIELPRAKEKELKDEHIVEKKIKREEINEIPIQEEPKIVETKTEEDKTKKETDLDDKKKNKSELDNKQPKSIGRIFLDILCYIQAGISMLWIIYCIATGHIVSCFLWLLVLLIFLPFVKKVIVNKYPKLRKYIIPARVILLILAFFVMVFSIDTSYSGTWESDSGMTVTFESSESTITFDNSREVSGTYEVYTLGNDSYRIEITGSDGNKYNFIYKYGDENKTLCYEEDNKCIEFFNKVVTNK